MLIAGCGAEVGALKPTLTQETEKRVRAGMREYFLGGYDIVIVSEGACTCGRKAAELMAEYFSGGRGCAQVEVLIDDEAADTCHNIERTVRLLRKLKGLEPKDVDLAIVCEPCEQFKRALVTVKAWGFRLVSNKPVEVPGGFTLKRRLMGWIFLAITLADPKGTSPLNFLIQHSRKSRRALWDKELARKPSLSTGKTQLVIASAVRPNMDGPGNTRDFITWRVVEETTEGYSCERGWWIFREKKWFAVDDPNIAEVRHEQSVVV